MACDLHSASRAAREYVATLDDAAFVAASEVMPKFVSPTDSAAQWAGAMRIAPHIPVIDKSKRDDGTFSREDFRFDPERNIYLCPAGKVLTTTGHIGPDHASRYQASLSDCRACVLKPKCCPKMPARQHRKSVEMLFSHLKLILRLGHLRLRGPYGAQDEFTLAAISQNLRWLAKLAARPPPAVDPCLW
jgi:hypothetical protein